jgi:hypothetical protein
MPADVQPFLVEIFENIFDDLVTQLSRQSQQRRTPFHGIGVLALKSLEVYNVCMLTDQSLQPECGS